MLQNSLIDSAIDEIDSASKEIDSTISLVKKLMQTPHYARLGEVGIYAIVAKARSLGMSILEALNGSLFFVGGKVEMTSAAMNAIIRSKGHSITKDDASSLTCCILRGKRCDTGDTWTASFSIDDAKRAGLFGPVWTKYPDDMLFARALSRLARQLFPDVIKGCYVQGEIDIKSTDFHHSADPEPAADDPDSEYITPRQIAEIRSTLDTSEDSFKTATMEYLVKIGISDDLKNFPKTLFLRLINSAKLKQKK